jgi:DNA-binding NarL/FixJ family response regulator
MDLKDKTVLVAMGAPAWLVSARLEHAGAEVLLADDLASARRLLHDVGAGLHVLIVGLRLPDGYAGSLVRDARSGPHPCAAVACVTDPASESLLVAPALAEGPWDLLELPRDTGRLIPAAHSTARRTEVLRRWACAGNGSCARPEPEADAPVARQDLDQRIIEAAQALASPERLSQEELEVLRELVQGHRPPEIAVRTGKSVETVRTQLKAVRSKLGKDSLVPLVTAVFAQVLVAHDSGPQSAAQVPGPPNGSPKQVKTS